MILFIDFTFLLRNHSFLVLNAHAIRQIVMSFTLNVIIKLTAKNCQISKIKHVCLLEEGLVTIFFFNFKKFQRCLCLAWQPYRQFKIVWFLWPFCPKLECSSLINSNRNVLLFYNIGLCNVFSFILALDGVHLLGDTWKYL